MQLNSTLAWLVDEAARTPTPELFLAGLGGRLIEDGEPLAGGALTLASPHPLIARRALLWRAGSGEVIEALGFVA
ncbi:MAG: adenylate/guanylate cyclase domain-containing protein, partial [Roseiarcus sp.]